MINRRAGTGILSILLGVLIFWLFTGGLVFAAAPIGAADVEKATEGCTLVTIEGAYQRPDVKKVVDRVNQIRKEAYEEKIVDEYVPKKGSGLVYKFAEIRAAEAAVTQSHSRTNDGKYYGSLWFEQAGENLAWASWEDGVMYGIDMFYSEKSDRGGHYMAMVEPFHQYFGIAAFNTGNASWTNCVAMDFAGEVFENTWDGPVDPDAPAYYSKSYQERVADLEDTSYQGKQGTVRQLMDLSTDYIDSFQAKTISKVYIGKTVSLYPW